ncbi:MAG TPA: hypothetical protein PLZ84_00940, partial [Clostridia bacterium]|nr:hypothetical protein [Clostridia bacterium]
MIIPKNDIDKKNNILVLIGVFIIIFLSSGFPSSAIQGKIRISIMLLVGIVFFFFEGKRRFDMRLLVICLILSCCVLITSFLWAGDSVKDTLIMLSTIAISMLVVSSVNFRKYCEAYIKIMLLISAYSVIVYALSLIVPWFIKLFPAVKNNIGDEAYNLGLTYVRFGSLLRNMGIFWEPGAYQTYLVFAILIELFLIGNKSKLSLIIFFITLFTTLSTAGIQIGVLLLFVCIIEANKNSEHRTIKNIIAFSALIILIPCVYYILPPNIQFAVWGKLFYDNVSTSVRYDSVILPLKAYFASPFIGVGLSGLKQSVQIAGHMMTTNTPVNWFAAYGLIFGLIFSWSLLRLSRIITKRP